MTFFFLYYVPMLQNKSLKLINPISYLNIYFFHINNNEGVLYLITRINADVFKPTGVQPQKKKILLYFLLEQSYQL